MTHFISSIDAGNGFTNAITYNEDTGKTKSFNVPTLRTPALGIRQFEGLETFQKEVSIVQWGANSYAVGDDALAISDRVLERHMGENRYGNEFHRFAISNAIANSGIGKVTASDFKKGNIKDTVSLLIYAPPDILNQKKTSIIQSFMDNPEVRLTITTGKRTNHYTWRYDAIHLIPEGVAAAFAFILDEQGNKDEKGAYLTNGKVAFGDFGSQTFDIVTFTNGQFNVDMSQQLTFSEMGITENILQPIATQLRNQIQGLNWIKAEHIDYAIRHRVKAGKDYNYTLPYVGNNEDLNRKFSQLVNNRLTEYLGQIANNILDRRPFEQFEGYAGFVPVGGGGLLGIDLLTQWYGKDKVIDPQKHPTTKKVSPTALNAVGGLRLFLYKSKQANK